MLKYFEITLDTVVERIFSFIGEGWVGKTVVFSYSFIYFQHAFHTIFKHVYLTNLPEQPPLPRPEEFEVFRVLGNSNTEEK